MYSKCPYCHYSKFWDVEQQKCGVCLYGVIHCDTMEETKKMKMKVTLPNGLTLEGLPEQVADTARRLGVSLGEDGVYYMSSSLGLVKISEMGEQHLRNAILKRERARLDELKSLDLKTFLRKLANGTDDITTLAMVRELAGRYR